MNKLRLIFSSIALVVLQYSSFAQFGQSMGNVILPSTDPVDWIEIRREIKERVLEYWGHGPSPYAPLEKINFRVDSQYIRNDLIHVVIRYEVIPDDWDRGILVLPKNYNKTHSYKTVLTIHGTNGSRGADGLLDKVDRPNHIYPIELANKGFICFVPDHFLFGESVREISHHQLYKEFSDEFPGWSITGRQLLGFVRSLDVLDALHDEYNIDNSNGYGVMGHSLGGRTALYLSGFDDRIATAVVSTGISPMISNTFRGLNWIKKEQPKYWDSVVSTDGHYPWEIHEMIAICAPKKILFLEPINDNYNPYIDYTVQALMYAAPVWRLLEKPENFSYIIHGNAHETGPHLREYAYDWFIRML